jgi:hypothetical protein
MPCYTLHDDDPEAILFADVLRQVRADRLFWRVFSKNPWETLPSGRILALSTFRNENNNGI